MAHAPVGSLATHVTPPDRVQSVEQLEELLSEPTEAVVAAMRRLDGDILLLGVGGKIGPSLARMAKRAHLDEQDGLIRAVAGADG